MNGLEGDGVIPAGRPENDTVIGLENPFFAAVDTTDGGLVVPEMTVIAVGPTEKVKSDGGGGGGGGVFPPPQPKSRVIMIAIPSVATERGAIRFILRPSRRRRVDNFISVEAPQQPRGSPLNGKPK